MLGGHVKNDETVEKPLVREFGEKTGLHPLQQKLSHQKKTNLLQIKAAGLQSGIKL